MFQFTSFSITSFFTAIIALSVALIAYPRRKLPGGKPILAFMIAVMFWASFEAFDYAVTSLNAKILMAKLEYIGELSTPVFYLLMVLEYNHMQA